MRVDIEKYLGTVTESTAKKISNAIGLPQLEVAKELNRMHGDGAVEREKRHGAGNEYVYWLARSGVSVIKETGVVTGITIVNSGPGTGATAVLVEQKPTAEHSAKVADPEVFDPPEFREVDESMAILCALLDIDLETTEAPLKAAIDRVLLRAEASTNLLEMNAQLQETIAKLRENTAALERSIDDLTGVADVKLPKVYVTVGRYAKPKRHADLPRAQRRAAALVRNEKEAEVLVLAPVGRMVRGSEWRSQ